MSNDDLVKKREIDLGKFWKTGLNLLQENFIKDIRKQVNDNPKAKIGKSVEKELSKAYRNIGLTRKIFKP